MYSLARLSSLFLICCLSGLFFFACEGNGGPEPEPKFKPCVEPFYYVRGKFGEEEINWTVDDPNWQLERFQGGFNGFGLYSLTLRGEEENANRVFNFTFPLRDVEDSSLVFRALRSGSRSLATADTDSIGYRISIKTPAQSAFATPIGVEQPSDANFEILSRQDLKLDSSLNLFFSDILIRFKAGVQADSLDEIEILEGQALMRAWMP